MPYTVIQDAEGCGGYAVVKVGERMPVDGGCHALKSDAMAQMVALNIATKDEREERYDPAQPRDDNGKFASGSSSGLPAASSDDLNQYPDASEGEIAIVANQQDYLDGLHENRVEAIDSYTAGGHEDMNKVLRGGPPPPPSLDDEELEIVERNIERVERAIDRAPRVSQDVKVYRSAAPESLGLQTGDDPSKLIGQSVRDDGLISTSFSQSEAQRFTNSGEYMLEITVPKGSKGLALQNISNFPEEREFLLGASNFTITGIKDNGKTLQLTRVLYNTEAEAVSGG